MTVVVKTEDAAKPVPRLGSIGVGRSADVRLGPDDDEVHGVAFWILDHGRTWEVEVPLGRTLEVVVTNLDSRLSDIVQPGGGGHHFDWSTAEVRIVTSVGSHRAIVDFDALLTSAPMPALTRTGTKRRAQLDPRNTNDRALIVACTARLDDPNAGPLPDKEIAELLTAAGYDGMNEDRVRMNVWRATLAASTWLEQHPDWPGGKVRRPQLVDFLVATGSVNRGLLDVVLRGPVRR